MRKNTIKVNGTIFNVNGTIGKYTPGNRSLYDVYGRPSSRKVSIWYKIENICNALKGYNLHVTSHNCMMFCCEFYFKHSGKEYCMYFSPSRWYQVYRVNA